MELIKHNRAAVAADRRESDIRLPFPCAEFDFVPKGTQSERERILQALSNNYSDVNTTKGGTQSGLAAQEINRNFGRKVWEHCDFAVTGKKCPLFNHPAFALAQHLKVLDGYKVNVGRFIPLKRK